ncbi:hypothetical protein PENTCL1PPCAC_14021, partial [Pristionchus entomophagus]
LFQSGLRQSPIDIRQNDTDYEHMDRLSFTGYDQMGEVTLENNGHTVSASGFTDWANRPFVSGGDLEGRYFLQELELHWGQNDDEGSEHTIRGYSYPAEMHLIHLKEGLTIGEALTRSDG